MRSLASSSLPWCCVAVVVALNACAVDNAGLGSGADAGRVLTGAAGASAGTGGSAGAAGAGGVGGAAAPGGSTGSAAADGGGSAEPPDAHEAGASMDTAKPDTVAGEAGAGGATGSAGAGGSAAGAGGAAGSGGTGGAAGGTAGTHGCGKCPACFRCDVDTCEPDPSAQWLLSCDSATIEPLKPTGAVWDSLSAAPPGTWPDTMCVLSLPDGRMRSTPLVMDSLMPVWKSSVTPTTGAPLTSRLLMSSDSHWRITLTDIDTTGSETVCTTLPVAKAADLRAGALTLEDVGSCMRIALRFTCLSN